MLLLLQVGNVAKSKLTTIVSTIQGISVSNDLNAMTTTLNDCFAKRDEKADIGASLISEEFKNCVIRVDDE